MRFALLTLISSLSLAAVAEWFSIIGFMAIYAGGPVYALTMGIVLGVSKLVTTSWLYRNWEFANWKLKLPLIYFTIALMIITSIGVFGLLSKIHLEQGASTIDNSSKIETLNYQIQREKSLISDNDRMIDQLDAIVNSYLGKDRIDRSLSVRKSQSLQRKQLKDDNVAAQERVDLLNSEKFKLESEVRKSQLDVGPIRYIAESFYGTVGDSTKNIESAVRIFTILIVSSLDPLAVILLIAANQSFIRLRNEKEKNISPKTINPPAQSIDSRIQISTEMDSAAGENEGESKTKEKISFPVQEKIDDVLMQIKKVKKLKDYIPTIQVKDSSTMNEETLIKKPIDGRLREPWAQQKNILRELLGNPRIHTEDNITRANESSNMPRDTIPSVQSYIPMSWLTTFKR